MNSWSFIGRLGRDAEMRYSPKGDAILSFSVAVDSGYGERKSTTWPRCTIFGKRAESLAPYLLKGARVGITGEVTLREYETDSGKRQSLDVRVADVTLLSKAEKADAPAPAKHATPDMHDDDIPF